jgi:hypothetical protein
MFSLPITIFVFRTFLAYHAAILLQRIKRKFYKGVTRKFILYVRISIIPGKEEECIKYGMYEFVLVLCYNLIEKFAIS